MKRKIEIEIDPQVKDHKKILKYMHLMQYWKGSLKKQSLLDLALVGIRQIENLPGFEYITEGIDDPTPNDWLYRLGIDDKICVIDRCLNVQNINKI